LFELRIAGRLGAGAIDFMKGPQHTAALQETLGQSQGMRIVASALGDFVFVSFQQLLELADLLSGVQQIVFRIRLRMGRHLLVQNQQMSQRQVDLMRFAV
jgi:hypothetical protein